MLALTGFCAKAVAEDCTGVLPGADCTLDEDTTAPLTIDAGVTLTIGGSVLIGHAIDADDLLADGAIETFGLGNVITQTAPIGGTLPIDSVTIADDNTWTTSSAINTDNSGADIDLGAVDGGETLNFIQGGSFSGEIDGNVGDIVNFGSDGNGGTFSTGGQIETVTVIVTSGSLTANNTLGGGTPLGALNIVDGASMTADANVFVGGALDIDGSLVIAPGNTVSANTYTADADAGSVTLEVSRSAGATETGQLNITAGGPVDLSNDVFEVRLGTSSEGLIDETIANIIIGNTAATIAPGQFIDDSFLYNFSLQPVGDNFDLVIEVNPLNAVASNENNLRVAEKIFGNLAAIEDNDLNRVQALLGRASSSAEFNNILESLQPVVDRGYVEASMAVKDHMNRASDNRVHAALFRQRHAEPRKKMLAKGGKNLVTGQRLFGKPKNDEGFDKAKGTLWVSTFGSRTSQSEYESIQGYDLATAGVVIGADTGRIKKDHLYGLTFVAGRSEIDSDNANSALTDIDSYGLSFYGGSKIMDRLLLANKVSYVHNDHKVTRRNIGGIADNEAFADYTSEHLALQTGLSYSLYNKDNLSVVPRTSLIYDYIESQEYSEIGPDQLALALDYKAIHEMALELGVDLDYLYTTQNGINVRPSANIDYQYKLRNDQVETIATFDVAPDERFTLKGYEPPKNIIALGTKVGIELTDKLNVLLGYDVKMKTENLSHSGFFDVSYEF